MYTDITQKQSEAFTHPWVSEEELIHLLFVSLDLAATPFSVKLLDQ